MTDTFPNKEMEAACLKAHKEGRSRPLQEFIDELKTSNDKPND